MAKFKEGQEVLVISSKPHRGGTVKEVSTWGTVRDLDGSITIG